MTRLSLTVLGLLLEVVACAAPAAGPTASPAPMSGLTLFVAASLGAAMDTAAAAYASESGGLTISQSNGSSTALRAQIEQGAPADIFLSADATNPQALARSGLTVGPPLSFARNSLAIVVPAANPARVISPADLAKPGLRIVAAGDQVPISGYATTLLANLAQQPGYPADFAAAYAANIVSREDDVRAVLAKVELGEADAAIVYATDAKSTTRVMAIPIPHPAQVPVEYSGVVLARAANQRQATDFLSWLAGPGGQAILGRFGFLAP